MPYYYGVRMVKVMTTEGLKPSPGAAVLSRPFPTRQEAENCRARSRADDAAMSPVFFADSVEEAERRIERDTPGNP